MTDRSSAQDPRSRRSRTRLLTALREVARHGDLTIPAVSSAAGVTRATFYNHFAGLEEAAWCAMLESFDDLWTEDSTARRGGSEPSTVGVDSLSQIVELLRADDELVRLADTHRTEAVLPGLVNIVMQLITEYRIRYGNPSPADQTAADTYIAAGLYAVLLTGSRGEQKAEEVAATAYSLLPVWMRRPRV